MARTKASKKKSDYDVNKDVVLKSIGFKETFSNGGVTACNIRSYDETTPKIVLFDMFPSMIEDRPYTKTLLRLKLNKAKAIHELLAKAIKEYEKLDAGKYKTGTVKPDGFNPADYI